jgi:hypothetical protein
VPLLHCRSIESRDEIGAFLIAQALKDAQPETILFLFVCAPSLKCAPCDCRWRGVAIKRDGVMDYSMVIAGGIELNVKTAIFRTFR